MTHSVLMAREGIRHTMASYSMAGDRLRAEDFTAVFTEDAILETEGVPAQDAFRHVGRQAIHDWRMHLKPSRTLEDLARMIGPMIRGWIDYYGRFYRSEQYSST